MNRILIPLAVVYGALGALLPVTGRLWIALPLSVAALLAVGDLWLVALPPPVPSLPGLRAALAALTGLMTLPLVALALYPFGVAVRPLPLAGGVAVVASCLAAASVPSRPSSDFSGTPFVVSSAPFVVSSVAPTIGAVVLPVIVALGIGGIAVHTYERLPHPAEPGYVTVALGDWAASLDRPLTVPAQGIYIPVRVTSAGLPATRARLRLWVGGAVVATRPLDLYADTVRTLTVRLPALPADDALHPIDISVGAASTGFYARSTPPPTSGAARRLPTTPDAAARGLPSTPGAAVRGVSAPGRAGRAVVRAVAGRRVLAGAQGCLAPRRAPLSTSQGGTPC
ncbi:hypothetical protein [Actinoplanes sp. NPDC051851]|uniref:hypothetical protein n=1 Tax=Actinoplanes sp. NPDC051851 TaxID=3154753 RepID=UPI0034316B78